MSKKQEHDPFAASEILGLSAKELRSRALSMNPLRAFWTNRTDIIPPVSDERTAIIDRGLVLRGLLTQKQLEEIHSVGDLWNAHHASFYLAEVQAHGEGRRAAASSRKERAQRRQEKRQAATDKREQRRQNIAERRATDIIYLGPKVSPKLSQRQSNVTALTTHGLPVLSTPLDVAQAIGISIPKLRWLCYHAEVAEKTHYVYFKIPKRTGGERQLSAPLPSMALAQEWVLHNILEKLPTEACAHGFVKGRSTVTNAAPHLKQALVVNLDLSDFFPTITYRRVRGFFEGVGYSPAVATLLGLLCTEAPRRAVEYDGVTYQVAVSERALPQGACTSPAISNQIARTLDKRLTGACQKHGWVYTRYADDLTLSTNNTKDVAMMLARVRHIVTEEGFALNPKKGRVQRRSTQQTVTGIVVNDKLGLPRGEVRRLRAILHQAKSTGLAAQNKEGLPHFEEYLRGKIAYLSMIDPGKAAALLLQLDQIK